MSSYGHNFFFIMQMQQKNSKKRHRFFPKTVAFFQKIYEKRMTNT